LTFGLTLLPHNQTSEVYLEGSLTRSTQLNRNHTGPRAILNALTRLESTYQEQLDKATEDLALCHKQQQDYQHRLGQPFPDNEYLKHLTELRDKLRAGLSDRAPTSADETPQVPVAELASQIKALRSSHTTEDIPDRRSEKPLSQAEVPISARIHRNSTILQSSSLINNNQPTR
jgi:hypothetical protein